MIGICNFYGGFMATKTMAEDKLKKVGPYAVKRAGKILINKITGDK